MGVAMPSTWQDAAEEEKGVGLSFWGEVGTAAIQEQGHQMHSTWRHIHADAVLLVMLLAACLFRRRGFINLGALYILWLCSAVFYHLPSFEALGIDIKADVSLTLSIACYSLVVSRARSQAGGGWGGGGGGPGTPGLL
jgi:hypothetical protein